MKFLVIFLALVYLVNTSEGYMCYECNSQYDKNCFDFNPNFSYFKAAPCDPEGNGSETCYAVQISDRKVRRMYRGCQKTGICEDYEEQERENVHFKMLSCGECKEAFCNSSPDTNERLKSVFILMTFSIFVSIFFN
ncbi:CLUMA_CG019045, isoform A [Clunio marinus]|uniref:CLUMA_CG019045, isoform A n=1 Tax=Clunio marinus TaxID=568069 RepID=A0A1J1J0X7_9DIPT|nr:CLUMA_CG019045, isoform A [Clunio marinus]